MEDSTIGITGIADSEFDRRIGQDLAFDISHKSNQNLFGRFESMLMVMSVTMPMVHTTAVIHHLMVVVVVVVDTATIVAMSMSMSMITTLHMTVIMSMIRNIMIMG
jgi:uncharacterized protein YaaW (UPF0174 family)